MAATLPEVFRRAMQLSLENVRQSVETVLTAHEKAWTRNRSLLSGESPIPALVQEMTKLARTNLDANFRAAQKLTDAKSSEEALRLYVDYVQERQAAFARQLQDFGRLSKSATNGASEKPDVDMARAPRSKRAHDAARKKARGEQSPTKRQKKNKTKKAKPTESSTSVASSSAGKRRAEARTAAAQATSQRRSSQARKTASKSRAKSAARKAPKQKKR